MPSVGASHGPFAAEAIGGVLLVLGVQARWVALGLVPALVGAIVWAHAGNGWVFTAPGGGWEYPLFLVIASVALVLIGEGAFALSPSRPSLAGRPGASLPLIEKA